MAADRTHRSSRTDRHPATTTYTTTTNTATASTATLLCLSIPASHYNKAADCLRACRPDHVVSVSGKGHVITWIPLYTHHCLYGVILPIGINPTSGTNCNPTSGTNSNPTSGTNSNPTVGTNCNPTVGTNCNPTVGTNPCFSVSLCCEAVLTPYLCSVAVWVCPQCYTQCSAFSHSPAVTV